MSVKRRILIKGRRVHSVGYRPHLMEKAQELKIPYFHAKNVKDKEDGKQVVDVRVGGEEGRIDNFLNFVHENWPEHAEVESITVEEKEYEDDIMSIEDFSSVLSASQLSKIVQTGLGMIEMQKQALGKHDQRLEKQDETISIIKSGVDEMREFRTETQQNFANLDIKYGKIAENMEKIMGSMADTSRKTGEVLERLAQQQENFNKSIDKLTDAILTLAKRSR